MDGGNSLSVDGGNSLSSMVAYDDHDDFANDDSLDENIEPLSLDLSSLIADKVPQELSKEHTSYSENLAHAAAGSQRGGRGERSRGGLSISLSIRGLFVDQRL
jgi:hypothetical protein